MTISVFGSCCVLPTFFRPFFWFRRQAGRCAGTAVPVVFRKCRSIRASGLAGRGEGRRTAPDRSGPRAGRNAGRQRGNRPRLAQERLTIHASEAQVLPTRCGIPWLDFVVYPTHRLLKQRNAVNFTRRLSGNLDAYRAGSISFAELDAGVRGWINHVRYADTWGLREHIFATHPIPVRRVN